MRSSERIIRAAIADGAERSPSFRRLLARLDESDVIVHVVWDLRAPHGVGGHIAFAFDGRVVRYLRIYLSPRLAGVDLVAVLGHELEHACEIADQRWVVDQSAMAALYEAIGSHDRYRYTYDTAAAVGAGEQIRRELRSYTSCLRRYRAPVITASYDFPSCLPFGGE